MTPQLALVTTGRYCVTVRIRKCNVCNVNKHYIPTRGVLFLCCHVQHVACSMLIEPKMSSGGRRAAEKSSCAHTLQNAKTVFPFRGRCDGAPRPSRARPAPRATPHSPRPPGRSRRKVRPVEDLMDHTWPKQYTDRIFYPPYPYQNPV